MAKFRAKIYNNPKHPTGLNKVRFSAAKLLEIQPIYIQSVDFEKIACETDDELQTLGNHWFAILAQTDQTDPHNKFRTGLLKIEYSYARLVALALAFQHVFGKNGNNNTVLMNRVSV